MGINDPIPNAAYPTPGQGLTLDLNGQLPLAVRQTLPGYEYAYTEFTANVSITATTEATANTVVTASAVTFDGATTVLIEFFCQNVIKGTTNMALWLYDGASSIGQIGAQVDQGSLRLPRFLTPSAAAKTYSVRGSVDAGTGTAAAGAGGVGVSVPGFIRITRA